jgi:DNA replication protein DnaC
MTIDTVKQKLIELRLKLAAANLQQTLVAAELKNWNLPDMLNHLLDLELEFRHKNRVDRLFKESRLIQQPTIDQFDFHFHKSRMDQKTKILNLMTLEFVKQKKDIILIGNTGVGKTFLARCIAYAAIQAGMKTLYTTTSLMINQLIAAEADHSLFRKLRQYESPEILVCDEIGYLPLDHNGSNLFFQVINARHEVKSTIITTNTPFAQWGKVFDNTALATAIADRLVYNSEILVMEGKSYRKRMSKK